MNFNTKERASNPDLKRSKPAYPNLRRRTQRAEPELLLQSLDKPKHTQTKTGECQALRLSMKETCNARSAHVKLPNSHTSIAKGAQVKRTSRYEYVRFSQTKKASWLQAARKAFQPRCLKRCQSACPTTALEGESRTPRCQHLASGLAEVGLTGRRRCRSCRSWGPGNTDEPWFGGMAARITLASGTSAWGPLTTADTFARILVKAAQDTAATGQLGCILFWGLTSMWEHSLQALALVLKAPGTKS